MTLEIAKQYLVDPDADPFRLISYEEIDDAAAKVLSASKGDLFLNGLKSLTDEAAIAFANHGDSYSFYGDDTYELQLEGVRSLSNRAAKELCRRKGFVSLHPIVFSGLDAEVAEALKQHTNEWHQIGAAKFSRNSADGGIYYGLSKLDSAEAALILAECHGGNLHLNNVTLLSPEAAETIARHDGEVLHLNGLESISLDVARAIVKFRGIVSLWGLPPLDVDEIPDEVDELLEIEWALAIRDPNFGCDYRLPTLLSVAAAEAFAIFQGFYQKELNLDTVSLLSPAAARELSGIYYLYLNGLKEIDLAVAQELTHEHVHLSLDGLTRLSVEVAQALARKSVALEDVFPRDVDYIEGRILSLNGLESLTAEVAAALVGKDQHEANFLYDILSLDKLKELSAESARNLVWRRNGGNSVCQHLALNGLEFISDEVAEALGEHSGGELSLKWLKNLSDKAMIALGRLGENGSGVWLGSLKTTKDSERIFIQHLLGAMLLDFE